MDRPFKSVVLVGTAHPFRGGLASYNERLIQEYIHQGYEAKIVTFTLQYPSFLFPGKTQFSDSPPPADIPIERRVNSVNPLNWIRIGLDLRKSAPDVFLFKFWLPFMGPCFGTIARLVRGNRKTRIITVIDNIIPHEHRPGDRLLTRYFVKPIQGFVAMSRQVREDLKQFNSTRPVALSPHPLFDNFGDAISQAEAKKKLGLDPDYRYVLFFGFIRDYKGLDWLLQAFADPAFEAQKVRLLIAGEFYNNGAQYSALIDELGLADRIVAHHEFIANEEVATYFCAADAVAQPYKNATQSGVTQIAYHFEKPMLVTDVGGLAELVPNGTAGIVAQPNVDSIREGLHRLMGDDVHRFDAGILEEKKKLGWDRMVDSIETIYHKIEL